MSLFKNDGNNPLAPILMVLGMGVLPMMLLGGIVGGALWLGVKAVMALTGAGSLAGILTPWTALGGVALLGAGQFTGVNQVIGNKIMRLFGRDPHAAEAHDAPPPPSEWKAMCAEWDAKKGFNKGAAPAKAAEPLAPPASGTNKPAAPGASAP